MRIPLAPIIVIDTDACVNSVHRRYSVSPPGWEAVTVSVFQRHCVTPPFELHAKKLVLNLKETSLYNRSKCTLPENFGC